MKHSLDDESKATAEAAAKRARERAAEAHVKVGVEQGRLWVSCRQCGQQWSPKLTAGGRLPMGWWKCPKGCNHK